MRLGSDAPDIEAAKAALTTSTQLQHEIWTQAVGASRLSDSHPEAGKLLLPALNAMIDITTKLGTHQKNIETNQQNIAAHEQKIEENTKDIEENTDRFTALNSMADPRATKPKSKE
jgi:hypothetical protein